MARNGSPDDPNNYSDSEPTQYANYGGTGGEAYSEVEPAVAFGPPTGYSTGPGSYPPEPPIPWYRKPAGLIGLGVLTAAVLALLVYAIVKFTANDATGPAVTSTTASTTTSGVAPSSSVAPAPGETTQTVTESPTTTTAAPTTTSETPTTTTTTTTAPPPSTSTSTSTTVSTSVSTSVSTVTETVTTTQRLIPTLFPRPGQ